MKLKLWIGLVLVAALGVGLAFKAWPVSRPKRDAGASREPVSVAPVADVARPRYDGRADALRMRQELAEVKAQLGELKGAVAAQEVAEQPRGELAGMTRQEQREYQDQLWNEHMAEVAAAFDVEPRDPSWAPTATQALAGALATAPAIQAVAGEIDCRSSSCRVELPRDADGNVDKELLPMVNSLSATLPEMEAKETTVDGRSTYTLYFKDSRRAAPSKVQ